MRHITGIIVAAVILAATVLLLWAIFYIIFIKDRKESDKQPAQKKKKGYGHLEINEIMGYDFIRQISAAQPKVEEKAATPKAPASFADSKGIGVTKIIGTTGRDEPSDEDGPRITREQYLKQREREQLNEQLEEEALSEGKTVVGQQEMAAMEADWPESWYDNRWPENNRNEDKQQEGGALDWYSENETYVPDEEEQQTQEEDQDPTLPPLAATPEHQEEYDDVMQQIFAKQDALIDNFDKTDEKDEEAIRLLTQSFSNIDKQVEKKSK